MAQQQPSITKRVRAVILLASAVVLIATAAAFVIYEAITFRTRLVRNLSTLAALIADNSAAPLAFENREIAEEILSALQAEPDIVAAALYNAKGELFARFPPSLQTALPPVGFASKGHEFRDGGLELFEPVLQEEKPIGTLYLRSSLRDLYEQLWRYSGIVAAVLAGSLATAYVLSAFLGRRISDPILALTRAAQAVSQRGDYSVRAAKLTDDEIGALTESFNQMLSEIQKNQRDLAEQARLMDLSTDAIIVRDMDDVILYWNRGAEELYGWSRQEVLGKTKSDLLHTRLPEPRERITASLLQDRRWAGDLIQTRRDGTSIHVSARWSVENDAQGKPARVLTTDTDITARKQAEELMRSEAQRLDALVQQRTARLQETVGELEAFSYSISHDMRAPLRAMQGYARALLDDHKERLDSEAQQYLDRIARAANRLDALVQDVLSYTRVAKGEIELHRVDLERLIDDILSTRPEFQEPQSRIRVEKPLHRVLGHEAYLTQCITNLLGNAVKFVVEGTVPEVRIRSERLDGKVRLWFEDNGIGIDPAHHQRIFQIFGQVYPEKKYGGTGIGLAIVRKAAQRMSGDVGLESQIDKGSRFWLILDEVENGN
jgi:PAS domain S-box-containing protein